MSKNLKKKTLWAVLAGVICIAVFGVFLMNMQTELSLDNQIENTREKLEQMQEAIDKADAAAEQNQNSYDEVYQSKAASIAYMAEWDEKYEESDAQMQELVQLMNVDNALILDEEGNVLACAKDSAADFTRPRFNQLRTVFSTGLPSEGFNVEIDGVKRRYYGAAISGGKEAVIEQNPEELDALQKATSSWQAILGNMNVGLKGFTFAVSNQDYTFLYHPKSDLIGKDALDAGIRVNDLEEQNYCWMTIEDEKYYCGVTAVPDDYAFIICAVPESEINSARNMTVAVVLFAFFIVVTVICAYAVLLLREQEKDEEAKAEGEKQKKRVAGGMIYNRAVGKKVLTFSLVGVVLVSVLAFYMQTLFSLSLRGMSNEHQAAEVAETIALNEEEIELVTSQYNTRYLNKCQIASYILGRNPKLWTKEDLAELSRVLGVEFLLIFDRTGREIVSDSTYVNFKISRNPEDQSYPFGRLLQGVEYYIQEAQPDELSGTYHQYIGVTLKDENGDADGFVQMAVVPEKLEQALKTTGLSAVLGNVKASAGGFAFAVDKESRSFSYFPDDRINGKSAEEYGMKESQFRDRYCDYLTIDNQKYFATSLETENNYIYIAVSDKKISGTRGPVALASGIACILCLAFVFIILSFSRKEAEASGTAEKQRKNSQMVDVVMPDGSIRKTESAASRWANENIHWEEKTPEQKVGVLLKGLMFVFALAICICVMFKERFITEDSIISHILDGNWEKGVNVFSVTASIMIICVCQVLVMVIQQFLRIISKNLGARGDTVCRMLRSFVKYFFVIAMLYYCLALFGIDTKTLLASAGILTFVVGLGAKELLTDILSGLFIIFEGEFQVGDIVTVGDWRGTVQEIGIRTTKIMDPGENVKVISNSAISGVINMTKRNSYCSCDVCIECGESLERVEAMLAEELPKMKEHIPAITDGPFYQGVISMSGNNVNIRIVAQCKESDRAQLGRDMNRYMKILFDEYNISL